MHPTKLPNSVIVLVHLLPKKKRKEKKKNCLCPQLIYVKAKVVGHYIYALIRRDYSGVINKVEIIIYR